MDRINDSVIASALEVMSHMMAQANEDSQANQNHNGGADKFHGLEKFQKNKPHKFKGRKLSIGGRIPAKDQKLLALLLLGIILRMSFWTSIFQKMFVTIKEIKFLELKQCNMFVADYVAKFEKLSMYCLQYNGVNTEGSKCVKF
ncbi:uncharacterized protein LOC127087915 [Lathyrus oleraceus]|uniref:uncharacterized protein LOC127087915 n=1 Tax=Pisum sativum TaxID=3888 RepID=UPI0021D34C4F|nr:uncharacterized protein LOC127087915 [Pisum sativum]